MRGSGNREDIDTQQTETQVYTPAATKTETKETLPFKKPVMPLPEHLKVTSIKDTLEKNRPITQENIVKPAIQETVPETVIQPQIITESVKEEIVFATLQDCWIDCIQESSTPNTIIAVGLLSKQIPTDNENHILEIEVPNEVAKQEIREIIPALTHCLTQKTGIVYSFDIKVIKTVQEKQIDKTNPDEKFMHLCKENPKLMDFKQRLNLSVS